MMPNKRAVIEMGKNKAVENKILPKKKPDVVVEKNYDDVSALEPNKKDWLISTAKKVYKVNRKYCFASNYSYI